MKMRTLLAALAGFSMVMAVEAAPVDAAAKARVKVMLTGDCADGEHVEDADEDDCEFLISVTPKKKNVSAVLEVAYDEEEPDWEEYDSGKTRGGRLIFSVSATDEDDMWMDGVVRYRVRINKTAGVTLPKMRDYKIEYISAEAAEGDEDLAEAWCTALAAPPAGMKVPCSMVLPRVFPPING